MRVSLAVITIVFAALSAACEYLAFAFGPILHLESPIVSHEVIIAIVSLKAIYAFAIVLAVALLNTIAVTTVVSGRLPNATDVTIAGLLIWLVGICAAVLSLVTFLVPVIVFAGLFAFAIPAVVAGGEKPLTSLFTSFRIAGASIVPTFGFAFGIVALVCAGAVLGAKTQQWSAPGGWLLAGLTEQGLVAYASYRAVRRYASVSVEAGL